MELALAFLLVLGTGLLGKSYLRLLDINPGYDPRNVLTLSLLPFLPDETPERLLALYDAVVNQMRALAGVEDAGYASTLPLSHPDTHRLFIRERPVPSSGDAPQMNAYSVSPGYLRAMKISLLRGRLIDERDRRGSQLVAMISEFCARNYFAGRDAIGQHIQVEDRTPANSWANIVGVVGDVHQYGLDKQPDPGIYTPYAQAAEPQEFASLVIRSSLSPDRLEPAVRDALHAVDPKLPVFHLQPMDAYMAKSIAQRTFALRLTVAFGGLALLLAVVGVYGVVSYSVGMRTREVGIRMALGAKPGDVRLLILRQVCTSLLIGLSLGCAASLLCGRFMASLLFEVSSTDWFISAGVTIVLVIVALAAAFIPAQRAAQLNPLRAIKTD